MAKYTPMMEQYFSIKARHKDAILMFRLGDFFEMFFEDAKIAAKDLDIALTGRDYGQEERAPMCGVPAHAVERYITRLVEKGHRVAICDQVEDAKFAKGIVKREVVRVVTPGTVTDTAYLEAGSNNYIAAVHSDRLNFSIAAADITTGLFMATSIPVRNEQELIDEIFRLGPAEILLSENFPLTRIVENVAGFKATSAPAWTFDIRNAFKLLTEHFGTMHLEGFGLVESSAEIPAAGALLTYLADTQKNALKQITRLKVYSHKATMVLDTHSRRNLELTASSRDGGVKGSLLWVLDHTKSAPGARLLRSWVGAPLMSPEEVNRRLDAVEEWVQMPLERAELREHLRSVHDLERITARLSTPSGTARDMATLRAGIEILPAIGRLLQNVRNTVNDEIRRTYDDLSDIYENIDSTLNESPPATVREGGMIRPGVDAELDKLRDVKQNAQIYLQEMEEREKESSGIKLKIRFNRVFGYYIEVSTANLSKVPEHYIRRQTLANCERFVTEELKTLEQTILGADEQIVNLEFEIFDTLRRGVVDEIARIQFTAAGLAALDTLQSLAEAAEKNQYVRPVVTNGGGISIKTGRHPVVERLVSTGFVPNDTEIDMNSRLDVITGPNMAGKSTYMRQVALIVLMAQIGSYVPADSAEIGVVDRIFTRVGASDDLATGQSTFMVEMTETANILNNATANSLILLDEIGRGTSTFDGLAIAWSVLEYIAKNIRAKTLFATHYHELTRLEGQTEGVVNYCFTAEEQGENIVFLRKLTRGEAGKSYGIHVARLAGLPREVLAHAQRLLNFLTTQGNANIRREPPAPPDDEPESKLIKALAEIEIEKITPLEAIAALGRMKNML